MSILELGESLRVSSEAPELSFKAIQQICSGSEASLAIRTL